MNKRGFTLMEVIIVIALMGILMAMATPSLVAWRESASNKEAARELLAGLRQSRNLAVTGSRPVTFSVIPSARVFDNDVANSNPRSLPGNAVIESWARESESDAWVLADPENITEIEFSPQGNSLSLIRLRVNNDDRLTIEINSRASGLARIN